MSSNEISFLYRLTKNEKAYKLLDKLSGELLGYVDSEGLIIVNKDFNTLSNNDMKKIVRLSDILYIEGY